MIGTVLYHCTEAGNKSDGNTLNISSNASLIKSNLIVSVSQAKLKTVKSDRF